MMSVDFRFRDTVYRKTLSGEITFRMHNKALLFQSTLDHFNLHFVNKILQMRAVGTVLSSGTELYWL